MWPKRGQSIGLFAQAELEVVEWLGLTEQGGRWVSRRLLLDLREEQPGFLGESGSEALVEDVDDFRQGTFGQALSRHSGGPQLANGWSSRNLAPSRACQVAGSQLDQLRR